MNNPDDIYEPFYDLIRSVPAGKVVTYGQAADAVTGVRLTARMAGSAMRIAPKDVPWHRVVGAGGALPIASRSVEAMLMQRRLLEIEGVAFSSGTSNRVNMTVCQWAIKYEDDVSKVE